MAHHESCKGCKKVFLRTLEKEFGEVIDQWRSGWPCRIKDVLSLEVMDKKTARTIEKIFKNLQKHRGNKEFVRAKTLRPCDYYIKSMNCLIEIDESQHFTALREIALSLYPKEYDLGFDRKEWINKCQDLDRQDNHPFDRDEKRAWYETLRDILPPLFGMNPTIRIFARDLAACAERPEKIYELLKSAKLKMPPNSIIRKESKMNNYYKSIVKNQREYFGKKLLLTNKNRDGLYRNNGSCIEVEIKSNGDLCACKFEENGKRELLNDSLRKIGKDKLGLTDPSVKQMLRYLVLPEMEIERIFNSLRYKYLSSLRNTDIQPNLYMTFLSNDLFKALIRAPFRNVKKNDLNLKWKTILEDEGFPLRSKIKNEEKDELEFIINYIRNEYFNNKNRKEKDKRKMYMELLAIKPGFHEVYIDMKNGHGHRKWLKKERDYRRTIVLKMIHNIYKNYKTFSLKNVNNEIKASSYLTYAACCITEGPFVYRNKLSVSYYDELKGASLKNDLNGLEDSFIVLDYWDANINTQEKLDNFLRKAKKFTKFI